MGRGNSNASLKGKQCFFQTSVVKHIQFVKLYVSQGLLSTIVGSEPQCLKHLTRLEATDLGKPFPNRNVLIIVICFWKRESSNFARPTFTTRKQDILSSVCVLPINVNGCSFQRNIQEMDHTILKFVDCKTCRIYLISPSTAYHQNK